MSHATLLALLLPPQAYARNAQPLQIELQAEGRALDVAERDGLQAAAAISPFFAEYTLPDWERVCDLTPAPAAGYQQRLQAVLAKLAATGGLSIPYFQRLASSLGYHIDIAEPQPFRAGINRAGDMLHSREHTMNSLIFDGHITRLQRNCDTFHTLQLPALTPRPPGEDGTQQGAPLRIRYLPAEPADKSVLELDDADYTWQLNAEQIAELETFITDFDPATAIAWPPPLPADEQERLTRAERDRRLLATDYLLMPDYPISTADLDAVKAYRQQLRDLSNAPEWPDVAWPVLQLQGEEKPALATPQD